MDLSDLTFDEDVLLLGFLREVIQADGQYSAAERKCIVDLRDMIGAGRLDRAIAESKGRFPSLAALKDGAKAITRPEARRAILSFLQSVAASDEVTKEEEKPLRWLASWWSLGK